MTNTKDKQRRRVAANTVGLLILGVGIGFGIGILWHQPLLEKEWMKGACTVIVQYPERENMFERMGCYQKFPELEQ